MELKVIKPFFVMEVNDTFEYSDTENVYVSKYEESNTTNTVDEEQNIFSSYTSEYKISPDMAEQLIKDGYLEPVKDEDESSKFVNVFDEIDRLLNIYNQDLADVQEERRNPNKASEAETVYANMIKVLDHLRSLKKK